MRTSETLRSVIDAGRSSKRLDELSAARVIGKIAQQIHAAQQKAGAGKAVGPVTPAHIKLAPSGDAKLELGEGSSLGYSSPEQTMGGFGDRRSDVFSLGAVLWEALTHQRLFDAMNDAAVRMAVQEREIAPPSEINANVPAELSAICMRALHRNPTDRYQSLKAMAVELEEFLEEAGYGDDDSKIASYLASMHEPPPQQLKIAMPPLARPASSTQPPPTAGQAASGTQPPPTAIKQPGAPSMLGEPPRPKSNSGAALAAALANAGSTPATSNGSTTTSTSNKTSTDVGLPPVKFASTAVGVPKLDEWQDSAAASPHAPPPAAAPVVAVAATSTAESVPQTPMPPVLPSGSTQLRNDKATIAAAVPPQVKVATVEAKHTEAKQPALIVEDKPKAQIVDDHRAVVELKPRDKKPHLADDGRTTLVDGRPPEIEVPKLVNGRLPDLPPGATPQGVADPAAATLLAATPEAKTAPKIEAKPAEPLKPSQVETVAVAPVRPPSHSDAAPATARAPSHSDAAPATARAPSQSEASTRAPSQSDANAKPHPVGAVSLGPNPTRDSKDVLAGWGWGTDKHNAIVPESYAVDDDYDVTEPDSRKMLVKIIGAGMGVVALIIIIAFAFGGSPKKKSTAAKEPDTAKPLIDTPAPAPTPAPETAPAPTPGSADVAVAQPAPPAAPPEPTEADKAAAAKAAADAEAARLAEEKKQAEAAKLSEAERLAAGKKQADEAKKAEAERLAAEKKQADEAKKAEAARLAAEKKQTDEQKRAEAARIAAEKKQADDAKRAEATRIAAEKKKADDARKAEAARIAAEKKAEQARLAEAKKAEAAKTAKTTPKTAPKTAPKTTPKRPATTKKTETKVATADTRRAEGKLEPEAAYRIGLQQFARGDTSGALASLRTSLAGNPNHAPTWRGLGLVFEKMGEKDQARAAFKRYLQLAPSAGDADQIRSRLERLGS